MLIPKPYEIYRHFKGNCYQIICIAQDSEDGESIVVYQGLYAPYKIYARKLSMFLEEVDKNKYPEASQKYRFELLDSEGFVVERTNQSDSISNSIEADIYSEEAREEKSDTKAKNETVIKAVDENDTKLATKDDSQVVAKDNTKVSAKADTKEIKLDEKKQDEINKRREQASLINPILAEFLDAPSEKEQLNIVLKYREIITEDILVPMELSLGMEVGEGRLSDRIFAIRNCLELRLRYERDNRH